MWVTVCTSAAVLYVAAPAHADEITVVDVGTWTRDPLAADPPEGGIAVANAPDGPMTVAAVRFSGSATGVMLHLPQVDAVAPLGAVVQACVTTSPWEPATNGDLAAAPAADCSSGMVSLTVDTEGVWSGDISVLLARSTSLVLLPGPDAPPVFSLTFEPPTVEEAAPATNGESGNSAPTPNTRPSGPAARPESAPSATAGSPPLAPFSYRPSELAAPQPTPTIATEPSALAVTGGVALPAAPGVDGSGRDLGQAVRLTLLALAAGFVSMPVWRLRDGQHVPGLSPIVSMWRRRITGADA